MNRSQLPAALFNPDTDTHWSKTSERSRNPEAGSAKPGPLTKTSFVNFGKLYREAWLIEITSRFEIVVWMGYEKSQTVSLVDDEAEKFFEFMADPLAALEAHARLTDDERRELSIPQSKRYAGHTPTDRRHPNFIPTAEMVATLTKQHPRFFGPGSQPGTFGERVERAEAEKRKHSPTQRDKLDEQFREIVEKERQAHIAYKKANAAASREHYEDAENFRQQGDGLRFDANTLRTKMGDQQPEHDPFTDELRPFTKSAEHTAAISKPGALIQVIDPGHVAFRQLGQIVAHIGWDQYEVTTSQGRDTYQLRGSQIATPTTPDPDPTH